MWLQTQGRPGQARAGQGSSCASSPTHTQVLDLAHTHTHMIRELFTRTLIFMVFAFLVLFIDIFHSLFLYKNDFEMAYCTEVLAGQSVPSQSLLGTWVLRMEDVMNNC